MRAPATTEIALTGSPLRCYPTTALVRKHQSSSRQTCSEPYPGLEVLCPPFCVGRTHSGRLIRIDRHPRERYSYSRLWGVVALRGRGPRQHTWPSGHGAIGRFGLARPKAPCSVRLGGNAVAYGPDARPRTGPVNSFLVSAAVVAVAEIGDKTQLLAGTWLTRVIGPDLKNGRSPRCGTI